MADDGKMQAYYFTVEVDGIETARFQKCEGLEAETYVYEVEEGGLNTTTHKFYGRTRYPNLVLEKGITDNDELFKWYKETLLEDRKVERKNGAVILKDTEGQEVKRWNFFRAFPCRWIGPRLEAHWSGEYAVERIEITHEGLELDNDSTPMDFPVIAEGNGSQGLVSETDIQNINEEISDESTVPTDAADNLIAAQDAAMNNPIYMEGGGGPFGNSTGTDTWCNQATFEIARDAAPGLADAMYGTDPNGYNTTANMAAANLADAAANADSSIIEIAPQTAQNLANQGYTVVAAWENPTGASGHLATVRPGETFNETEGPMLNNIGADAGTGIRRTSPSFISSNYANGDVHFYYDSEQFD